MNFTVDRDQLEGLLSRVQGVAERRHTMPVLSHTLVTAGANALTLVVTLIYTRIFGFGEELVP